MIVVDSSIWIAALRRQPLPAVEQLKRLPTRQILIGDLILLELLQGAANDANAERIRRSLSKFDGARMLDEQIAVRAASNYRHLRSQGITVRKTNDLIIATFCLQHDHTLFHRDRDYSHFVAHFGLRLLDA